MKRPDVSKRMKKNNPMFNRKNVEKMLKNRKNRDTTGHKNPNWRGGKEKRYCKICNNSFKCFPSLTQKTCSKQCSNKLKSINNKRWNKGLTKETSKTMKRISNLKKNIPRTERDKNRISEGTIRGMRKPDNWKRFIDGNKKRDKSFFKTPEWVEKVMSSKNSKKYIYKKISMRSNWEILFAEWLDNNNLSWEYEPMVTRLSEIDKCYCPDFYVKEWKQFVEIKGYMSEYGQTKINAFKNKFGSNKLLVIREKEMKELGLI